MATHSFKTNVMPVFQAALQKMRGKDTPRAFDISNRSSKYGVWARNTLEVLDSETGTFAGYAEFSVYYRWEDAMIKANIMFHGSYSQYLARRHGIKVVLEERWAAAIGELYQAKTFGYLGEPIKKLLLGE